MGIIRYLSRYDSKDQVCKLYVRLFLNRGDMMYHNMTQKYAYRLRKSLNRHNILLLWLLLVFGRAQIGRGFGRN